MPNPLETLTQVRIIKFVNRKLKPGLITWVDEDTAKRLIDDGCAVVYTPTIHDLETR
jgi:hypothetical protein